MRAIAEWAHMMSTTVQVAERTGRDGYGKDTYGTPVTYRAHLSKGARFGLDAQFANLVDAVTVYLNSARPIIATAQVTLSTADVGSTESWERQPRLLAVSRRFDGKAPHHTVLYCGWEPRSKSV